MAGAGYREEKIRLCFVEREKRIPGIAQARVVEHAADEEDRRRIEMRQLVEVADRRVLMLLPRRGGVRNDCRGNIFGEARGEKFLAQARKVMSRHVDDKRGIALGEIFPVGFLVPAALLRVVAGHDDHARAFAAIRERYAERSGCAESGGDAGNHVERDIGSRERVDLFGEAAEDSRVAALEAHNVQPRRAKSIMSASISPCVMPFAPQRFPTLITSACGPATSRMAVGTRSSCRTTSVAASNR